MCGAVRGLWGAFRGMLGDVGCVGLLEGYKGLLWGCLGMSGTMSRL